MWILLLVQMVFGAEVLVKAPQSDVYTYQVFLENSDHTRPSDIDLPCPVRDDLQQYYHSANDNYLNGSLDKAKSEFLEISQLQLSCDWKSKERQQITESLYRLSQLTSSMIDQKTWMRAAVDFDPAQTPDKKLFPPPLLKLFDDIQKEQTFKVIAMSKYYDTYTRILRNGRSFQIDKKTLKFPEGQARFTFLSDSHAPKTVVVTATALQRSNIESAAFINGDCKSFQFQKPPTWKSGTRLFFSPECIVDQQVNTILAETINSPSSTFATNPIEQQIRADSMPRKPTWIERNYLWVGAALVGAVLISAEMNKRKDTQTVITPSNSMATK